MVNSGILKLIGNTAAISLQSFSGDGSPIIAKLEGSNPFGSIKDRAALYMTERAEERGELSSGMTILEATSGNMGIALAAVGRRKGYDVKIVMSSAMSKERRTMIQAYGAELILTEPQLGTEGAITEARQLAEKSPGKYWFVDQFNNPDNAEAHYHGTAEEIFRQVPDVSYIVAGIGTCGTLAGIAKRINEDGRKTKIAAVLPPEGYKIQGIQNPKKDFSGSIFKAGYISEFIPVSDREAQKAAQFAARIEGLFPGMSSGAVLATAKEISGRNIEGNIVAILADRGEKYLSTGFFGDDKM